MPSLYWFRRWITPLYFPYPHYPSLTEKVGLFPESYTQSALPTTRPPAIAPPSANKPQSPEQTPLQPRQEDSGNSNTTENAAPNQTTARANGEVMRATMTVVQQAHGSRDELMDHETYHDTNVDVDGQDRHVGARQDPAEKAKGTIEEFRDAAEGPLPGHFIVPPIDFEVSNDSGDEGDGPLERPSSNGRWQYLHIPEEYIPTPYGHIDHPLDYSPSIQPSERFIVPSPVSTAPQPESEINGDETTEASVTTATQPPFPQSEQERTLENNSFLPSPASPRVVHKTHDYDKASDSSERLVSLSKSQTLSLQEGASVLPSPTASWDGYQHSNSISNVTPMLVPAPSALSTTCNAGLSANGKWRSVDPVEWTVEEVVDWLRSKGFDEMVCDKFSKQEITGDVLLQLDVANLKSEIDIITFGKRKRIANAITDLRHAPNIPSSSAEQHTGSRSLSPGSPFVPQGISLIPMAQGSLNWPLVGLGSPPDSRDLMGRPFEPVRPGPVNPWGYGFLLMPMPLGLVDPWGRPSVPVHPGPVEHWGRPSVPVRPRPVVPSESPLVPMRSGPVDPSEHPLVPVRSGPEDPLEQSGATSNGGIQSNASVSHSRKTAISNGGFRSNATIIDSRSIAFSNGGTRSKVTISNSRWTATSNGGAPFLVGGAKTRRW